jgi:hypothetical protein
LGHRFRHCWLSYVEAPRCGGEGPRIDYDYYYDYYYDYERLHGGQSIHIVALSSSYFRLE